ncbi:MAG: D-alanyl-D-alanine carboxypeptidase/D-alanyl-D-alanine-endopeptidase [Nannocystis sp.]|nr:D-alanyl-D-alanine carboxypeptidase/D-alanyl-D-alanine-endopeptidase [Nannocystis sp.]MBA3550106.1 D-alanyl-D-alanine carboxypeptidase/D-alanyl-D-alanine-endopeptidase [Nannocystis sp.]
MTGSGSAIVAPTNPALRAGWLKEKFTTALTSRPQLSRAKVGYYAVDLTTGAILVAQEPEKGLNLASNAKLLTSVAALRGLGGGFRWRTSVHATSLPDVDGKVTGNLYIKGRGDPMLSLESLRQLAHDVAARGVLSVEGNLVVDGSYFDNVTEPPHFNEQPKETAAFRAPVASFGVNRSSYTVTVLAQPEGKAKVTVDPSLGDYLKLTKDEVTSVTEGRTRLRLDAKPRRDQIALELTGTIRQGQGSWDLRRRVDDPARFAAEVFLRALAENGVKLGRRSVSFGTVPASSKLIATHDSATLADVLRSMNKSSDNYVAECVMKTLGAETKAAPNATWADGVAAVRGRLAEIGVTGTYRSENGSGLFASTEVSAKQLVSLLAAAHRDYRIGPDLVASLPTGGYDGTLARRFKGKPAMGRVRAKTGTLDRVKTLAGYVAVESNHVIAFAILVNDIPGGQRGLVTLAADDMVGALVAYLEAK